MSSVALYPSLFGLRVPSKGFMEVAPNHPTLDHGPCEAQSQGVLLRFVLIGYFLKGFGVRGWDLGLGAWGLGLGAWGLGFGVWVLGFGFGGVFGFKVSRVWFGECRRRCRLRRFDGPDAVHLRLGLGLKYSRTLNPKKQPVCSSRVLQL